jgi:hypothetical protein
MIRLMTVVAVVAAVIGGGFAAMAFSTHRRVEEFRIKFPPGATVSDLVGFAGKPNEIIRKGDPLEKGFRSSKIPKLDENTAVYFFGEEGLPYYNVYVLVDETKGEIISTEVDVLW